MENSSNTHTPIKDNSTSITKPLDISKKVPVKSKKKNFLKLRQPVFPEEINNNFDSLTKK